MERSGRFYDAYLIDELGHEAGKEVFQPCGFYRADTISKIESRSIP